MIINGEFDVTLNPLETLDEVAKNYFANYSLIVYASDIQVIRHEKF